MWAIAVEGILLMLLTGWLLWYYGSPKHMQWYVILTVYVGWFFVFSVVILLPNDISGSLYRACLNQTLSSNETDPISPPPCELPISLVSEKALYYLWEANYWTAFMLSWAVGPLLQNYVLAGGFTFWQKAWQSLKENLILYGIMLVLGVGVLIYIGVKKNFDMDAIMGVVMALANAYGLVFVICFLGYGLVEVPKRLWAYGNRDVILRYHEFKASSAKDTVDDTAMELVDTIRAINTLDRAVGLEHQFRKYVDVLVSKCPADREKYGTDSTVNTREITQNQLISLNAKITEAIRFKHRADVLWHQLLVETFRLQDVIANRNNPSRMYTSDLWKKSARTSRERLLRKFEWYWHVWIVPISFRIMGVLAGLLSLLILWCEVTMFSEKPVLSIFNLLLHSKEVHGFGNYTLVLVIVSYMSLCAYSTLMKLRLFNYYYLVGNHQTDENSLLFSAAYLSRLTFPLTYNFALMTGVDGTVFQQVLGQMEVIPLFGIGFNTYLPILTALICFLVLFDVCGRLMRLCNIQRFRFTEDFSDSSVEEGRELIEKARERALRHPDLFFSGVTELPADRSTSSSRTPRPTKDRVGNLKSTLKADTSDSTLDDDLESQSTGLGKVGGFLSSLKDRAQGKGSSKKDQASERGLLPRGGGLAVEEERDADLDDMLNIEPVMPAYSSRIQRNRPQKDMFSDV